MDDMDFPIALMKGARPCVKYPIANYVFYNALSPSIHSFHIALSYVSTPNSLSEVLSQSKWKEAMEEEMWVLEKNITWNIVDLPRDKELIRCKWVFAVKMKLDCSVDRCKAILVVKGYTQTYKVDYQ